VSCQEQFKDVQKYVLEQHKTHKEVTESLVIVYSVLSCMENTGSWAAESLLGVPKDSWCTAWMDVIKPVKTFHLLFRYK